MNTYVRTKKQEFAKQLLEEQKLNVLRSYANQQWSDKNNVIKWHLLPKGFYQPN